MFYKKNKEMLCLCRLLILTGFYKKYNPSLLCSWQKHTVFQTGEKSKKKKFTISNRDYHIHTFTHQWPPTSYEQTFNIKANS